MKFYSAAVMGSMRDGMAVRTSMTMSCMWADNQDEAEAKAIQFYRKENVGFSIDSVLTHEASMEALARDIEEHGNKRPEADHE